MTDTPIYTHQTDYGPDIDWVGETLDGSLSWRFSAPDNWFLARRVFLAKVANIDPPIGPDNIRVFRLDTPIPKE